MPCPGSSDHGFSKGIPLCTISRPDANRNQPSVSNVPSVRIYPVNHATKIDTIAAVMYESMRNGRVLSPLSDFSVCARSNTIYLSTSRQAKRAP